MVFAEQYSHSIGQGPFASLQRLLVPFKILINNCHGNSISKFQLLSECGYAQLKRLPSEVEFWNFRVADLGSDSLLKHIGTTAEGRDNYELLGQDAGRFGRIKIFLTCSHIMWGTDIVTVRIVDDGLKNVGINM
jgi:hypothetical protein